MQGSPGWGEESPHDFSDPMEAMMKSPMMQRRMKIKPHLFVLEHGAAANPEEGRSVRQLLWGTRAHSCGKTSFVPVIFPLGI